MISIDDFHEKNIELAQLIKKYGLEKHTWFAIQLNCPDSLDQIDTLYRMGFNIASHTLSHAFLSEIPIEDAYSEMKGSKEILDKMTGKNTDWLVTPRGRGNNEIYKMALDIGYKYIRTTKLSDDPYNFEYPELYKKIKGGNHLTYPRKEYDGIDPFEWAKTSGLNHFWGHMFEIERYSLWNKFEQFLIWYKEKYATT